MQEEYYELMYIIPLKYAGESLQPTIDEVTKKIESLKFKIHKNEEFGKLRFSYPIKQNHQGFYYIVEFEGAKKNIKKFNEWMMLKKEILRFLLLKKDPELKSSYDFHQELKSKQPMVDGEKSQKEEKAEEPKETKKIAKTEVKEESIIETEDKKEEKNEVEPEKVEKEQDDKKEEQKNTEEDKKEKVSLEDLDKKLDEILDSDVPTI